MEWMTKLEEASKAGAKYLDDTYPDWFNKIDQESLDIANCNTCILGQLWMENNLHLNGYDYFLHQGWLRSQERYELGFSIPMHEFYLKEDRVWEYLTLCWIEQIQKRRAEAGTML